MKFDIPIKEYVTVAATFVYASVGLVLLAFISLTGVSMLFTTPDYVPGYGCVEEDVEVTVTGGESGYVVMVDSDVHDKIVSFTDDEDEARLVAEEVRLEYERICDIEADSPGRAGDFE